MAPDIHQHTPEQLLPPPGFEQIASGFIVPSRFVDTPTKTEVLNGPEDSSTVDERTVTMGRLATENAARERRKSTSDRRSDDRKVVLRRQNKAPSIANNLVINTPDQNSVDPSVIPPPTAYDARPTLSEQQRLHQEQEERIKVNLKRLGAPKPPAGMDFIDALQEIPTANDLPPSYWDRHINIKDLPEDIDVRQMREYLARVRQGGARDRRLDMYIKQEADIKNGEPVPIEEQDGNIILGTMAGKLYNAMDKRYKTGLEHLEAQLIAEMQKLVKETAGTGPDQNMRLVFAHKNSHGTWITYDGKKLSRSEITIRKRLLKEMKYNPALYQAKAAYEITKLESPEQPELWQRLINVQINELKFSEEEAMLVIVGLQYMNKPTFLTYKHRNLIHPLRRDPDGNIIRDSSGRASHDTSQVVFGPLKEREYATELAQKFKPYEMQFEPADVSEIEQLAERIIAVCDSHFYDKSGRQRDADFLDALYVLSKLKYVIDQSSMGPSSVKPGSEEAADRYQQTLRDKPPLGTNPSDIQTSMYPPRISGSAEANEIWRRLAEKINRAVPRYPVIGGGPTTDQYPRLSPVNKPTPVIEYL